MALRTCFSIPLSGLRRQAGRRNGLVSNGCTALRRPVTVVLRHVAPILLGSAFLGMEGGRAVFLGRISLNYLILILLFVKTFALNFTQKQTFVLCVLHLCSAKSVS